jgi:hypothetical protein
MALKCMITAAKLQGAIVLIGCPSTAGNPVSASPLAEMATMMPIPIGIMPPSRAPPYVHQNEQGSPKLGGGKTGWAPRCIRPIGLFDH